MDKYPKSKKVLAGLGMIITGLATPPVLTTAIARLTHIVVRRPTTPSDPGDASGIIWFAIAVVSMLVMYLIFCITFTILLFTKKQGVMKAFKVSFISMIIQCLFVGIVFGLI
jgi:hypothetical protein